MRGRGREKVKEVVCGVEGLWVGDEGWLVCMRKAVV